ncbi:MAG: hypothetical protein PVG25_07445, partial [Anaerolineae bacterium]
MIKLTLRHLGRHWRLNGGVLLCLTLASTLLVSLSGHSAAVAEHELSQTLAEASPHERSLLLSGSRYTFNEELYRDLDERLGDILGERLVIRHATLVADPEPSSGGTGEKGEVTLVEAYSFSVMPDAVRVLEGRLPVQVRLSEAQGSWRPPPIEAVIGLGAAELSGYTIGDRVVASKGYHRLDIVGIVEPLEPQADLWGEDLSAFAIDPADAVHPHPVELTAEGIALPLIVASASMRSVYPDVPIFLHDVTWRVTLNHDAVKVDDVKQLHSDLINFQTQSATVGAGTSTRLVQLLAAYVARLSRVRMTLLLLMAQSLYVVFYTLTVFTSAMGDRSRTELATLSARGASLWQITGIFAIEGLILVLPAALLFGPGLAQAVSWLWRPSSGSVETIALSREAWVLSGVVAGLGWVALLVPVFVEVRRGFTGWLDRRVRPSQLSAAQERYLDLYLLAFGGLLTWQLNRSGSFVMRAVGSRRLGNLLLADPLLLIGPSLLLIAGAMVFLRAIPLLLRPLARLAQRLRGSGLPLGVLRLAQAPVRSSRVVLLIGLTLGLMLFARTFQTSLAQSQDPLRPDALAQGIGSALRLNGLTLVVFSVTAFFLAHLFAAQERERDLQVLHAMGLSTGQLLAMSVIEGVLVLTLGLLAGTVVGVGLSRIMMPYLSQALADLLADGGFLPIPFDWSAIAQLYGLFTVVYGSALVALVL